MKTRIECLNECVLLGIHISNDLSDTNIFHSVHTFNRKCNELRYDFKLLPSDIKSQLFSSFWLDAYGSQLWKFNFDFVLCFMGKMVRLLWNLPRTTHCVFLSNIISSLPMDIGFKKVYTVFMG